MKNTSLIGRHVSSAAAFLAVLYNSENVAVCNELSLTRPNLLNKVGKDVSTNHNLGEFALVAEDGSKINVTLTASVLRRILSNPEYLNKNFVVAVTLEIIFQNEVDNYSKKIYNVALQFRKERIFKNFISTTVSFSEVSKEVLLKDFSDNQIETIFTFIEAAAAPAFKPLPTMTNKKEETEKQHEQALEPSA